MTPLTAAQVAKARKSFDFILNLDSPGAQSAAIGVWASLWAEKLLAAAEILTSLQDEMRVKIKGGSLEVKIPARFTPQPTDPDT